MFKAIRIAILLLILAFVSLDTWLTFARTTDCNDSLRVSIYPINGDGTEASTKEIERLEARNFESIEAFVTREVERYGRTINRPVRITLGREIREQPPAIEPEHGAVGVMWWSLKMRWWASSVTDNQDRIKPDARIFVRYFQADGGLLLENSVGVQKGMYGVVNAYASRHYRGHNNVIIAHELLHTLGATDKYEPGTAQPIPPHGLADPDRVPLYPQELAEIMGGRIAVSADDAEIPKSLKYAVVGPETAREIGLLD